MRTLILLAFLTLPGCVTFSSPPRHYDYQVDLRNASGRPVSVEFLRIESGRIGKTRCDLAVDGCYTSAFTTHNSAEYLEARFRLFDQPETAPRWIVELPQGQTRADIILKDDRLTIQKRPSPAPEAN